MSAPKYSAELLNMSFLRSFNNLGQWPRSRNPTKLAFVGRGQLGREMTRRANRALSGEFVERGERRRPWRVKTELHEVRMKAEPLEGSGGLLSRGAPASTKLELMRTKEGNKPPCLGPYAQWGHPSHGYYARRDRPGLAIARSRTGPRSPSQQRSSPTRTRFCGYRRIRAGPARHGIKASAQTILVVMAANDMVLC